MGGPIESSRSREPQQPNRKAFPVETTAIQEARMVYSNNRFLAAEKEHRKVEDENQGFDELLTEFFKRYTYGIKPQRLHLWENPYREGAMFVHLALRNQVAQTDDQLPIFIKEGERDDVESIFNQEMGVICTLTETIDPDMQAFDLAAQLRINQLANEDSEENIIGKAIIQQSDTYLDIGDKHTFLVGAMFAYFPLKTRYEETVKEKIEFARKHALVESRRMESEEDLAEIGLWTADDPELAEFATSATEIWKAQDGTKIKPVSEFDEKIIIDTTDLDINFEKGLADLEDFLHQQGGQQG